MSLIEIVIAVLVVLAFGKYITYVVGFFTAIIPVSLLSIMAFIIALDLILFVIHRRS